MFHRLFYLNKLSILYFTNIKDKKTFPILKVISKSLIFVFFYNICFSYDFLKKKNEFILEQL